MSKKVTARERLWTTERRHLANVAKALREATAANNKAIALLRKNGRTFKQAQK